MSDLMNPPAFPCEAQGDRNVPPEHDYIQTGIYSSKFPGMSLRDWFAGQVLIGELSGEDMGDGPVQGRSDANAALMARRAYHLADAMLAERAKAHP